MEKKPYQLSSSISNGSWMVERNCFSTGTLLVLNAGIETHPQLETMGPGQR
jgi:hypothetical protein